MTTRAPGSTDGARGRAAAAPAAARYDRVTVWLHWGIGVLLLAEIAFGLFLDVIAPRGTPARAGVINLHKSFGVVLGLLIVLRIAWRLGHVALYACMVVAPLAGYLGSNFSKHGIRFFGIVFAPWGPDWPAAYSLLVGIHDASTYLLLALVVGHVAMALKHALIERDGIFARIAP